MQPALAGVLASAVCSGVATILQSIAVRQVPTAGHVDPGLLVKLARNRLYIFGFVLLVLGFGLSLIALRTLPLFVVQAGRASSLAVAAGLSVLVLRERLKWTEVGALGVVVAGLALLGLSAASSDGTKPDTQTGLCVFGALLLIVGVGVVSMRFLGSRSAGVVLAVLAGLAFALVAIAARCVDSLAPLNAVRSVSAWAMGVSALVALLFSAMALQRASIVTATGCVVVTDTLVAAGVGVLVFGDRPATGDAPIAIVGFVMAVLGSLALARFGAPAEQDVVEHAV